MSRAEMAKDFARQSSEAKSVPILEASAQLRAAAETMAKERKENEILLSALKSMMVQVPEKLAESLLPMAEALEAQTKRSRETSDEMVRLAKRMTANQAALTEATKEQTKKLSSQSTQVTGQLKQLSEKARHLETELAATRQALKGARVRLWHLVVLAAVPVAAVAALAHRMGMLM